MRNRQVDAVAGEGGHNVGIDVSHPRQGDFAESA